jgi:hypothetical protein
LLIDIDEFRKSPGLRDRLRGCNKRVRDGHHYVAGLYATSHDGEAQSVGPAAERNRKAGVTESREGLLKSLHHGTANETRCG